MADSTIQPASSSTSPYKAVVRAKKLPPTHPKWYDMVIEAIVSQSDRKGVSLAAIKTYISQKYLSVDPNMMKFNVRRAIEKGLENGLIVRPKASEESRGVTGRFKLDKTKLAALNKPKEKPKPAKVQETKPKKPVAKKTTTKKSTEVGKSPGKLKTPKKTKSKTSKAEKTEKPKSQKAKPAGKTTAKAAKTTKPKAKAATKPKTTPKKKAPPKPRAKKRE